MVLTSRSAERAATAAAKLDPSGERAHGIALDLLERGTIQPAAEAAAAWLGPVDILVNNAGLSGRTSIDEECDDLWDDILAANLDGPFFMVRAVLPRMRPTADVSSRFHRSWGSSVWPHGRRIARRSMG